MADIPRPRSRTPGAAPKPARGRRAGGGVRERILQVATRELAARGFDGTTLQAVADEVGVSKPSVLHYFPSKEALRAGVIADILEHWKRLVPQILLAASREEHPFDHLSRELIGFFVDDPDRARLLVRETLDRPREFRKVYLEHVQPWIAMFGVQVREGQQRGIYRADLDPTRYLRHMLQLVVVSTGTGAVIADASPGPSRSDARDLYRELLRIARTSLFKDSTAPGPRAGGTRRGRGGW